MAKQHKRGIAAYKRELKTNNANKHDRTTSGPKVPSVPEYSTANTPEEKEGTPELPLKGFLKQAGTGGVKKAAKLLLLLGKKEAAAVMARFTPEEVEAISKEITKIPGVRRTEAEHLLEEFHVLKKRSKPLLGGSDTAAEMLINAFGTEKGLQMVKKYVPDALPKPFGFLADLEFHQVSMLLKGESPLVLAIILKQLPPVLSSKILELQPPEKQMLIVKRAAKAEKINAEVISRVEDVLWQKYRRQGKIVTEQVDGQAALAAILRNMPPGEERQILNGLKEYDPDLYRAVDSQIITIHNILDVSDKDLQVILREFGDREIAMVMKGKSVEIQEKLLANVSQRRAGIIREEYEDLGSIKREDGQAATTEFVAYIREREALGEIVIRGGGETFL